MDKNILVEGGVNYDEGVGRFSGQVRLYEKYLKKFAEDPTFAELQKAMQEQDFEQAFRSAHNFKGLVGNLSLNILYGKNSELVEALRNGNDTALAQRLFPEVEEEYKKTVEVIRRSE